MGKLDQYPEIRMLPPAPGGSVGGRIWGIFKGWGGVGGRNCHFHFHESPPGPGGSKIVAPPQSGGVWGGEKTPHSEKGSEHP